MMIQTFRRPAMAAAFAAAIAAIAASPAADAATSRTHLIASTAICEAPLPQYGLPLKKGPFAITNQGTTGVFLSCALPTDSYGGIQSGNVNVVVRAGASAATVNCTMASGHDQWGVHYQTTAITVAANGSGTVSWANVNKEESDGTYAFSCVLPPGYMLEAVTLREESAAGNL